MEMGFAHCDEVILKESPLPVYAKSLSLSPILSGWRDLLALLTGLYFCTCTNLLNPELTSNLWHFECVEVNSLVSVTGVPVASDLPDVTNFLSLPCKMQFMFLFIPCILTLFSGQCYYDYFVHLLCLDAWWLFSMPCYACLDLFLFEDVDSSVLCCTYVSFWINIFM